MKRILLGLGILLIALLLVWANQTPPVPVDVYIVKLGDVEQTVANTRSGTVEACQRSKLAPSIGARIAALYVSEGDQVKTGQLLVELSNSSKKAALSQAEAALQSHKLNQHSICIAAARDEREAQRFAELAKKELAAVDIVDRATSKANASEATCLAAKMQEKEFEAQLQYQQAQLDLTYIRAPFSGTVAEVTGEVGEFATPSPPGVPTPPIIDLLTADCFYLTAPIDEVDAGKLRVGAPAKITLDAFRGQTFPGEVKRIAPYVKDYAKQARTVDIEVSIDAKEHPLLVGYSADVEVILNRVEQVLRVPTEAIIEGNRVWVLNDDNLVEERSIEVGIGNWRTTEVKSGLSAGERVITSLGITGLAIGSETIPKSIPAPE